MGNGKITKELKGLGTTINGKEPSGETVSEVIKGINDDYEGGGSGATYTAGNGIAITEENVINADVKVIETSNITGLTTEQCEALNVGDIVVKLTSNQKHTYTVSYKEAGVGMCLTYVDASTSETVSYDYIDNAWVYNSTDITPLKNVVANPTLAGTEANLTGLQVGDTKFAVKGEKLYTFVDIIQRLDGKVLNWTKFVAFLSDLGIDTNFVLEYYIFSGEPTVLKIGVSSNTSSGLFAISGIASGSDVDYNIEFYNIYTGTGNVSAKSFSNMFSNEDFVNSPIDSSVGISMAYNYVYTYIANVLGVVEYNQELEDYMYVAKKFEWEDFFNCFDEYQSTQNE